VHRDEHAPRAAGSEKLPQLLYARRLVQAQRLQVRVEDAQLPARRLQQPVDRAPELGFAVELDVLGLRLRFAQGTRSKCRYPNKYQP
jgi:hypothetical protein